MKKIIALISGIILLSNSVFSQLDNTYSKFLIFKSQAIDYYPVWGESDNEIYINIMSQEWRKYDLTKTSIQDGSYLAHKLAINTAENYTLVSKSKTKKSLEKNKDWKPREIIDKTSRKITLELENFNTALFIEYEKGKKEKIMNIQGNAHSLAISPSGKYLACLFEMTGLMIFDLEKEVTAIKEKNETLSKMSNIEKAEYYLKNSEMDTFKKVVSSFSEKEKSTIEYNYYNGLACYFKSEKDSTFTQKAIQQLTKVCDDSRYYDANIILSSLYQNVKDWENSLKYAEKSIEFVPDHPSGYTLKADYYEHTGEQLIACEYYQKALDKGDQWVQLKLIKCK